MSSKNDKFSENEELEKEIDKEIDKIDDEQTYKESDNDNDEFYEEPEELSIVSDTYSEDEMDNTYTDEEETEEELDKNIYDESENEYENEEISYYEEDFMNNEGVVTVNKKSLLMPCTVASIAIFLIAICIGAIYLIFFNLDLNGSYVMVDDTGTAIADTYMILEENGIAKITSESVTYGGTYQITPDNLFSVNVQMGQGGFQGDFNYVMEGNNITGKTLTVTYLDNPPLVFKSVASIPTPIKPVEGFKADEKLIGTWEYYDEAYGYTMQYIFNEDGTMSSYTEAPGMSIRVDFNYEVSEETIEKTYYMNGESQSLPSTYAFDGDILVLDGIGFTKIVE